jgi:hypothetical protein
MSEGKSLQHRSRQDETRPRAVTLSAAVAAIAYHLAGLTDIAELLGALQEPNLGADDPPRRGASPPRPLRFPPRPTIRRGVQATTCQIILANAAMVPFALSKANLKTVRNVKAVSICHEQSNRLRPDVYRSDRGQSVRGFGSASSNCLSVWDLSDPFAELLHAKVPHQQGHA